MMSTRFSGSQARVLSRRAAGLLRAFLLCLTVLLLPSNGPAAESKKKAAGPPCSEGFKTKKKRIHPDIILHKQQCSSPSYRAFVLEIDLTTKNLDFFVTPYKQRRLVVSEFAKRFNALAAVNGGFWVEKWGGFTVSGGKKWPKYGDNERVAVVGFGGRDKKEGKIKIDIRPPEEVLTSVPGWMDHALSGVPLILDGGKVLKDEWPWFKQRHPRTGLGVTQDGKTLFIAVVDGRRKGWSRGMGTWQLGELFKSLGAHRALNLDGGSSSTMVVPSLGGLVNKPCFKKGPERNVPNHLGIIEKKTASQASTLTRFLALLLPARFRGLLM